MPSIQKPTLALAVKYFMEVDGQPKGVAELNAPELLHDWQTTKGMFDHDIGFLKAKTAANPKPTLSLVYKYFKSVMGEPTPTGAEVNALLTQWKSSPAAFQKSLNSMKAVDNVKKLGPTKPAAPKKPVTGLKPGQTVKLGVPDITLSPAAKAHLPDAEAKAKAAELKKKIADYEKEIKRLIDAQNKARWGKGEAEDEKERLKGIDEQTLKYFSYIEKHCSQFLKEARSVRKLLYRGQDDSGQPIFVGRPRDNREPKDSSAEAQRTLDGYFKLLGFKALRSNSIFTSADYNFADGYGDVYAIFPKNGFSFTWSTKHADVVLHSASNVGGAEASDVWDDLNDYTYTPVNHYWLKDTDEMVETMAGSMNFDYYDYGNKEGLKKVKAAADEVKKHPAFKMLKSSGHDWDNTDSYDDTIQDMEKIFIKNATAQIELIKAFPKFAKYTDMGDGKSLTKKLAEVQSGSSDKNKTLKTAQGVIKSWGFTKENLPAAMKSNHEICIFGEYIAVDAEKYREALKQFFIPPKPTKKKP